MTSRTDAGPTPDESAQASWPAEPDRPSVPTPRSPFRAASLARRSPLTELALWATAVAVCDLGSKQIAFGMLTARGATPVSLIGHAVRLAIVLNDQSAFGVSLGTYTWQINLVLTFLALVLAVALCPALAAIDGWAPVMLGLIAGAATGNLVSLLASPGGVPDFIAVTSGRGRELVANVADLAAIVGLVLLFRTAGLVGRAVVEARQRRPRQPSR